MQVHVNRNGTGFGPYEEHEAQSMFARGQILGTDLVWYDGMAQWRPASQVFSGAAPVILPKSPMPPYPASQPMQQPGLPPKLHWGFVLLLGMLTSGIFLLIYLQHHMTRISDWKKTGVLLPQ